MNKKRKQDRLYWRNLFYKSIILIAIKLSLNVGNSSKLFLRILRIIHEKYGKIVRISNLEIMSF